MFHINLHQNKNEYITHFILENGYWEKHSTELINEILKKNNKILFVDIGANLGYYSLFAASLGVKSVAFEPIKKNNELFEQSINKNGYNHLIKLNKFGLGNEKKMVKFNVINRNMGGATLHDLTDNLKPDYTENVMILLADDLLFEIEENMFIKMDVENMELDVINGMINTLSKGNVKYLLIEISKIQDQTEIFSILEKNKFSTGISLEYLSTFDSSSILNLNSNYLSNDIIFVKTKDFCTKYIQMSMDNQMNVLFMRDE